MFGIALAWLGTWIITLGGCLSANMQVKEASHMRNIILFAAALAATTASAGPVDLIQNGGFETIVGGPGRSHEFGASYIFGQTVQNWSSPETSAFNLVFYPGEQNGPDAATQFGEPGQFLYPSTLSPDGGNFIALDGDSGVSNPVGQFNGTYNGVFEQMIGGLTIGQRYTLNFFYAAAQYANRVGDTQDTLYANFGGETQSVSLAIPSGGFSGWQTFTGTFTASATSQVLSFLNVGTPNGLPPVMLLDGVSLTEQVPEPALLGLFGLGLAGLALRARRQR